MARNHALNFAFALFMVAIATYTRLLLEPTIQSRMPFCTYTLAVIIVAWVTGVWPAILALVVSTICAAHYVIPPEGSMLIAEPADQLALAIFFVVGIVSVVLFSRIEWERTIATQNARENQELNEELRKRDMQKDMFLSLLAHELRSPLSPIGNSIAILERSADVPADIRLTTEKLSKNFRHLVRLVNDLLDVSRYMRDAIQLRRENIDLVECIKTAVEMTADELHAKQHRLTVETPDSPVVLLADQVRICQILSNLLSNAIRYTPACGEICVALVVENRNVNLSVRDTGLGISSCIQAQIFTPFFQASPKQSRFAPGLGLGLSIVKKLVELHGGSIEVSSQGANTGSTFNIHFPSEILVSHEVSNSQKTGISRPVEITCAEAAIACDKACETPRRVRILIADDDLDTANTLSQLLRLEGFETAVANSGLAAVQKCLKFQPQVLLLDIGLPELNGFEVAERVRSEFCGERIRIIAVSGWGAENDRRKGIEAGFDAHLLKPVNLSELLPMLTTREFSVS